MERSLICASVRRRRDWAGLSSLLLHNDNVCGKWKETQLDTHDIATPLSAQRVFHGIFISPSDVESAATLSRIERLYSLTGGQDSGIIFLLKKDNDKQNAVFSLMTLQLKLLGNWELPIFPVESVTAVPASLRTLQRQLVVQVTYPKPSPASTLLPFCSDREPLTNHTVNVLTDITSDSKDLIGKLSSSVVFESEFASLLGEDALKLKNFWTDDLPVD
ncbi:hypothetical protein F4777DRAFT_593913 [Nemania sp. FL0916]|nr:hypothetical protein F4777DRAFT_593913 [Nemania sp. FL0916]